MPRQCTTEVVLGGVAVLLLSVGLTGGCPGYLEEQAWFRDGGRVVVSPRPDAHPRWSRGAPVTPRTPATGRACRRLPAPGAVVPVRAVRGGSAAAVKMDGAAQRPSADGGRARTAAPRPTP